MKNTIKNIGYIMIMTMILFWPLSTKASVGDTYTITFHSNSGTGPEHEGTFDNGATTNAVTYEVQEIPAVAYSHTSNIDDTGLKTANYGNSWTSANITGTNRGDVSKAHVISFIGADHLIVELYYNGESPSYDWVSIWQGSHPTYTAANNATSEGYVTTNHGATISTNKFGGSGSGSYTVNGNTLTKMAHQTLTISGDSVTFAFKSDGSGYGQGYGYYAIVSPYDSSDQPLLMEQAGIVSGTYAEPSATDGEYRFASWNDATDGTGNTLADISTVTTNTDLYAIYKEDIIDKGNYGCVWKLKADGTLIIGTEGQNCTLTSGYNYNSWPWHSNRASVKSVEFKGTVNAGTSLYGMFYNQTNLTDINFTGFSSANATNMNSMFQSCSSLTSLDISSFNTSNVTTMSSMFYNCSKLTSLDLSGFDTSSVTDMNSMFSYCSSLTSLDLSGFDTSNVTSMANMFRDCSALTGLDLSSFDISNVTHMGSMFENCSALTDLDLSGFDTSNVTNMQYMFSGCSKLTSLDVTSFDTSKVTSMYSMFGGCSKLSSIDLSGFDISNVTSMDRVFENCSSLTALDLSSFNTSNVTSMNQMFRGCLKLTDLDLSGFDTSKVTNMAYMFYNCSALTDLDISSFDTSKVTNVSYMFRGCSALTGLDLTGFKTSKVTDMSYMFYGCSSLTSLIVSSFDTSNVTNMFCMFYNCSMLTNLDLSGFDTGKVTSIDSMFYNISSLKSIVIPDTFTFNGNGAITGTSRAFLNTSSSTKKWKRVWDYNNLQKVKDSTTYTAQELTDAWDAETMAGLWVWEDEDLSSSGFGDTTKISTPDTLWSWINDLTQKIIIKVFDDTQTYYMTEEQMDGFISDIPADPGYKVITDGEGHVTNTSTTQTGTLTIMKNVNGPVTDEKFAFDIELTGTGVPSGTRAIDGAIFNDGKARIYLADGESKTISGLREGIAYTVQEETPSNYDLTATGNTGYITAGGQIAIFTNNYHSFVPAQPPVSFTVRKQVDALDYDANTEYTFHAYFENLDQAAVCTYQITGSASQNFTADSDGTKVIQFKLKKDQQIVFGDIPAGTKYQISEAAGDYRSSYTVSDNNNLGKISKNTAENSLKNTALSTALETADSGELINITFTNILEDFEDIAITKNVPDSANDETEFEFTANFTNMKPNAAFNSDIGRIVADDEGNAEKTFYLKNGQIIRFEQVPVGTIYRFTESKSSYIASYTVSDSNNQNKITSTGGANTEAKKALSTALERVDKGEDITVTFTNEVERKNLTVVVRTDGNIDDPNKLFHFTVQARDESNPVSGEYEAIYTHANGTTENIKLSFNGSGRTEFDLKKDEYVKILGLPKGVSYTVRQNEYTSEGIATSYNTQDERHETPVGDLDETEFEDGYVVTGILNDDKTEILANAVANRTITLSKTVSGNMGNKNDRFTFILLRNDGQDFDPSKVVIEAYKTSNHSEAVSSALLAVSYSGDIIQLSLGHDETALITTDANISYTLAESDYSSTGYRTYLNGSIIQKRTETFNLNDDKTFAFANTNDTVVVTYAKIAFKSIVVLSGMSLLVVAALIAIKKLEDEE